MKVSLNHMRYYQNLYHWSGDPAPDGVIELANVIGAKLGQVEHVVDLGEQFKGILVAEVVHCDDHPNADRLHVCKIDDGGKALNVERDKDGLVQVVCGAPNARVGIKVAWLPPGSTVPESIGKEPFVLEARDFRGVISNGMLASPKELALGDNHDGILEIDDPNAKPGDDFAKALGLDDFIFDIENKMFTHRPDCFGMLGVAREIAGIQQQQFKSPDWWRVDASLPTASGDLLPLSLKSELPELVPRFTAVVMADISVKPSPLWLQISLIKLGIRPISNVVDLTNYYMILTGQPLHAYDYDKVKALSGDNGATIVVRNPRNSEKISLLNGKTIEPRQEAIMIATDKQLIGLGGVMGGSETEVDDETKNIILEAATFDMYSIRRTSMAHGIFTDAVTRFSKGQSPLQTQAVLAKTAEDVEQLCGGRVASELIDDNRVAGREWVHPPVPLTAQFVNERLGFSLSAGDMQKLLENVEFVVDVKGDELTVTTPFWRTDIETREDVVEEVGRLYGFDKLPLQLPERSLKPVDKDQLLTLKSQVRDQLAKAGANEVLTYSFVHNDLLKKVGQDSDIAFRLSNALSPDLQYYRVSLTPSLLDKVRPNLKAGFDEFAIFELGKAHIHGETDPNEPEASKEVNALSFVYASKKAGAGAPYYRARFFYEQLKRHFNPYGGVLLAPLVGANLYRNPWLEQMVAPFEPSRSVVIKSPDGLIWGVIGEYKASVRRALKLPEYSAGFELDPLVFTQFRGPSERYWPLSKFPAVNQDITLKVSSDTPFTSVYDVLFIPMYGAKPGSLAWDITPLGVYQSTEDPSHKNVSFRITATSYEKTMTDQEVNALLDQVTAAAKDNFGGERI